MEAWQRALAEASAHSSASLLAFICTPANLDKVEARFGPRATPVPASFAAIAPLYARFCPAARKGDWQAATPPFLKLVDQWIEGTQSEQLAGWTAAGFSRIVTTMLSAVTAAKTAEFTALQQQIMNGLRKHVGKFRGQEFEPGLVNVFLVLMSSCIALCNELNNPSMATTFLRSIPRKIQLPKTTHRGPAARFLYYHGNLLLQRDLVADSMKSLATAQRLCPRSLRELYTRTYISLIVCNLRLGKIPRAPRAGTFEELQPYETILLAWRHGDLSLFDDCMERKISQLHADGTLLSLSKLRLSVQQTLLQRTVAFYKAAVGDAARLVIPMAVVKAAFRASTRSDSIDDEECMCDVSNLILSGHVQGYIDWADKALVITRT